MDLERIVYISRKLFRRFRKSSFDPVFYKLEQDIKIIVKIKFDSFKDFRGHRKISSHERKEDLPGLFPETVLPFDIKSMREE